MSTLHERVRARVMATPFTQKYLADSLGISRSGLSKRLHGHTRWEASELYRLADLLGCSVLDFDKDGGSR